MKHKIISILLITSLLFLMVAGIKFYQAQNFIDKSVLATGEVKGYQKREGMRRHVLRYPIIEFEDGKNLKQQFVAEGSLLTFRYKIGERVDIYYQPDDPQKARIKKIAPQWGDVIGGFLIGILLLLYCGIVLIHSFWCRFIVNSTSQHQEDKVHIQEKIKIHAF